MSRANNLLKREWQHLFNNKMLLISVIVILFIPIMYGGFFLGSIWDPYGKTSQLPVVVVNEDKGASLNGDSINLGNDIVSELKKDNNLDWHFESASVAAKDMKANKYYMMVTLPTDFSQHAASVTGNKPSQSIIRYTVAASKNYIGTVVDKEAITELKNSVSTKLSKAYVKALLASVNELADSLSQASDGSAKITAGAAKAVSGTEQLVKALQQYTAGTGSLAVGQASLRNGIGSLKSGSEKIQTALVVMNTSMPTTSDIAALRSGLNAVASGLSQLDITLSAGNNYSNLTNDLTKIGSDLTVIGMAANSQSSELSALSNLISSSSATDGEKTAMLSSVSNLSNDASKEGSAAADAGNILSGTNGVTSQLQTIEYQTSQLQTTVHQLNNGMSQANGGTQQLLTGLDTLRNGVSQLLVGSQSMTSNLGVALGGSNTLLSGVNTLTSASPALNGGALQIQDGLWQLQSGSATLTDRLAAGASELKLQPTSDATADQITNPVTSSEAMQGNVPNYGHALAPYVLSLGLFVGALVFNFIYPIRKIFGKIENGFKWWLAKFSVGFIVAILQATVLDLIMVFGLGLKPDDPASFVGITYATSLAYMSIVMFLSLAFNNPGRFFAMVLLVLQLGGSGGTFPLQLSDKFFQIINPYLPMTYSIMGLRQAISSGLGSNIFWSSFIILMAVAVVFNLFIIGFLSLRHRRSFKSDDN